MLARRALEDPCCFSDTRRGKGEQMGEPGIGGRVVGVIGRLDSHHNNRLHSVALLPTAVFDASCTLAMRGRV